MLDARASKKMTRLKSRSDKILQPRVKLLGKWPFIYAVLKGRNKYAVITHFQGWSRWLISPQGFHPWLLYFVPSVLQKVFHFLDGFSEASYAVSVMTKGLR